MSAREIVSSICASLEDRAFECLSPLPFSAWGLVIWSDKLGTGSSRGVEGVPGGGRRKRNASLTTAAAVAILATPINVRRVGSFTPYQIYGKVKKSECCGAFDIVGVCRVFLCSFVRVLGKSRLQ